MANKKPASKAGKKTPKKVAKPAPKAVKKPAVKKTVKKPAPKPVVKKKVAKPVVKKAEKKPAPKPAPKPAVKPVVKPIAKPVAKAPVKPEPPKAAPAPALPLPPAMKKGGVRKEVMLEKLESFIRDIDVTPQSIFEDTSETIYQIDSIIKKTELLIKEIQNLNLNQVTKDEKTKIEKYVGVLTQLLKTKLR